MVRDAKREVQGEARRSGAARERVVLCRLRAAGEVAREVQYFNLDVIISVGYRVKFE